MLSYTGLANGKSNLLNYFTSIDDNNNIETNIKDT